MSPVPIRYMMIKGDGLENQGRREENLVPFRIKALI